MTKYKVTNLKNRTIIVKGVGLCQGESHIFDIEPHQDSFLKIEKIEETTEVKFQYIEIEKPIQKFGYKQKNKKVRGD